MDWRYNPMALAHNLKQEFTKAMLGADANPGHHTNGNGAAKPKKVAVYQS